MKTIQIPDEMYNGAGVAVAALQNGGEDDAVILGIAYNFVSPEHSEEWWAENARLTAALSAAHPECDLIDHGVASCGEFSYLLSKNERRCANLPSYK